MDIDPVKNLIVGLWRKEEPFLQNGHEMLEFTSTHYIEHIRGNFIRHNYSISKKAENILVLRFEEQNREEKELHAIGANALLMYCNNEWETWTRINPKPAFWRTNNY